MNKKKIFLWFLAVEIAIYSNKYLIVCCYHSPNKKDNLFIEYLDNYLENVEFEGTVIIFGDINLDFLQINSI